LVRLRVAQDYERRGQYTQALAIYKKISKFSPDNPEILTKLADLYSHQGFVTDAKREYRKIAAFYQKSNRAQEAIPVYEKLIKLDKEDLEAKESLAGLYRREGFVDAAVDLLNEVAETKIAKGEYDAAEKSLLEAQGLSERHPRTVGNLVDVFRNRDERQKAMGLVTRCLEGDEKNPQFLNLLGNLHFEDGDLGKAEEIFYRIVESRPSDVKARIKLGRIHIQRNSLDEAFELYEPLINTLLKKQREEKAIGLLGLILAEQRVHLPALEKLASIYRCNQEIAKLEVVDKVILEESRKKGHKDKALSILSELVKIKPEDQEIRNEYSLLRKELGLGEEEGPEEVAQTVFDKDKDVIRETIGQAELYIQQGLVRNAKRILEGLNLRYPGNPLILQKMAVLDEIKSQVDEEEISLRVQRAAALESRIKEKKPRGTPKETPEQLKKEAAQRASSMFTEERFDSEKISTVDIFADTDIIPFVAFDTGEISYYDLKERIDEELNAIAAVCRLQVHSQTRLLEKELSSIISDFKKGVRDRFQIEDYEIHRQIGIALMQQGLIQEAIDELSAASRDGNLAMECFNLISQCYRAKRDYPEAQLWLRKAISLAKEGSEPYFALMYEMASLCEDTRDHGRALSLYREIRQWNPGYREVSARVAALEGPA